MNESNSKSELNNIIKYYYAVIFCIAFFIHPEFIHSQNRTINQGSLEDQIASSNIYDKSTKFKFSLMYALNLFNTNNEYEKLISNNLSISSDNSTWLPRFNLEYTSENIFLGAGIGLSGLKNNFGAEHSVGAKMMYSFLYSHPYYEYYIDAIDLKTKGSELSIYCIYPFIRYKKEKHQPFEISFRSGLTLSFINESQSLVASIVKDTINIRNGLPNTYYHSEYLSYYTKGMVWSWFFNAQCILHTSKYFSIILMDLTKNFSFLASTVPQKSVTVDGTKTIVMGKHKLNTSNYSYSFGLAFHF